MASNLYSTAIDITKGLMLGQRVLFVFVAPDGLVEIMVTTNYSEPSRRRIVLDLSAARALRNALDEAIPFAKDLCGE